MGDLSTDVEQQASENEIASSRGARRVRRAEKSLWAVVISVCVLVAGVVVSMGLSDASANTPRQIRPAAMTTKPQVPAQLPGTTMSPYSFPSIGTEEVPSDIVTIPRSAIGKTQTTTAPTTKSVTVTTIITEVVVVETEVADTSPAETPTPEPLPTSSTVPETAPPTTRPAATATIPATTTTLPVLSTSPTTVKLTTPQ